MTRLARRQKSRWINLMKKRGYAYRNGRLWHRWRWTGYFAATAGGVRQILDRRATVADVVRAGLTLALEDREGCDG